MKMKRMIVAVALFSVLLSGCRVTQYFKRLFITESESKNYSVRIREEFFIYFPPIREDDQADAEKLVMKMSKDLLNYRVDLLLNAKLEQKTRKIKEELRFLDPKYRIFIEPRFISFKYENGLVMPTFGELKRGQYIIALHAQIIVRSKETGEELSRKSIDVETTNPHVLNDFKLKQVFFNDIKELVDLASTEIVDELRYDYNVTVKTKELTEEEKLNF